MKYPEIDLFKLSILQDICDDFGWSISTKDKQWMIVYGSDRKGLWKVKFKYSALNEMKIATFITVVMVKHQLLV